MASTGQVTRGPLGIVTPQGGMDDGSDNGFLVGTASPRPGEPSSNMASWKVPYIYILVGGLEHFLFSIIYGIILPIDFHIFHINPLVGHHFPQ